MIYRGANRDYDSRSRFDIEHPVLSSMLGAVLLGGFMGIMVVIAIML